MAIANFIPHIWTAKFLTRLRKALVFANVVNNDYEGEISGAGDSVTIAEIGPVTINDYTRNSDITWQTLDDAAKVLVIDQAKYYAFDVDDVDAAQAKPSVMDAAMDEAAYSMADTVDQHIAGLYGGAGITNSTNLGINTAAGDVAISAGNVVTYISNAARYADESNCPVNDRFLIVPPWFNQDMVQAEIGVGLTDVPKAKSEEGAQRGYIGHFYGFDIYVSNNVSNDGTTWRIMFGHRSAISFAGQVTKKEAVRREDRFGDGIKGLYVYGSKVVRPAALGTLYAAEG